MNEKLYNILKDKGINLPPNLDDFNKMIEEDEKLKNNLSKFITQNNLDISLESKKKSLFSESPSQETSTEFQDEDEDGVFGTVSDYLSNVFSSFKRGYARGSAAEEATDILNPLAEVDYQQIAETEKTLEVLEDNKSEVLKDFEAKGFGGLRFLRASPEMFGEVLGMMLRTTFSDKALSVGAAGGATAGAATLGVGAVPAALGSTLVASSYISEFGSTVLDTIREKTNEDGTSKYDLSDPTDLLKAFSDEKLIAEAKQNGQERGIPVAVLDALTMKATGAAIRTIKGVGKTANIKRAVTGTLVESTGGGTGEAAAQYFDKGEIEDGQSIALEFLLESVGGSPVVAYNMLTAEKINTVQNKEIQEKLNTIRDRSFIETDPVVLEQLSTLRNDLVKQKNINNQKTAENLSQENVNDSKEITDLVKQLENTKEAQKKSTTEESRKLFEDQTKSLEEDIEFKRKILENTKKKNEFFALGEKINNKETLTDQEQKTYDDNKDIVDRVFNLVKKQKDKAGKKIDDKVDSSTLDDSDKNFLGKLFDKINFFPEFISQRYEQSQELRKLNAIEEIKEGKIAEYKNYAVEKYNEYKSIIDKVSKKGQNVLEDFNTKIIDFALQNEIKGKVFNETQLKQEIKNINDANGLDVDVDKTVDLVKKMMIEIEGLSQKILDNQIYQNVYGKKTAQQNKKRKEKIQIKESELKIEKDDARKKILQNEIKELKKPFVNPLDVIKENLGKYLTRSYRFFSDKNFKLSDTKADALKEAKKKFESGFIKEYQIKNKKNPKGNDFDQIIEKAENKANDYIDKLEGYLESQRPNFKQTLNEGISFDNVDMVINPETTKKIDNLNKSLGILQKRKDLDSILRTFLGEYKDLGSRYVSSIDKMTKLQYEQKFFEDIVNTFQGDLIQDVKPTEGDFKYFDTGSPTNPLNGKFIDSKLFDTLTRVEKETTFLPPYFLNFMRKAKTVWNPPNSRKNITGNIFAMVQNGYFLKNETGLSSAVVKLVRNSTRSLLTQDIPAEIKDIFSRASKQGLMNQSIGLNNLINEGSVILDILGNDNQQSRIQRGYDAVTKLDDKLKRFYGRVDDFAKMVAFEMESSQKSLQEFGVKYSELTDVQKKSIDKAAAEKVKNTFPTWSRIPDWYKKGFNLSGIDNQTLRDYTESALDLTISKRGFLGDFVPFKLETLRTYVNSIREIGTTAKKIKEIRNQIKQESDTNKLEKLKVREDAYLSEYRRRLTGSIGIGASQSFMKVALPVLAVSSIKKAFDENEQEEDLRKNERSYKSIRKFYPQWMDGHTLINDFNNMSFNKEKNRYEITTFDYSLENPYSLILDPMMNVLKGDIDESGFIGTLGEVNDLVEPNMLLKAISEITRGQDVYGNEINTDELPKYLLKQIAPPSMIHAHRNTMDMVEKGFTLGKLTDTMIESLIIRDYVFSPDQQFSFELRDFTKKKKSSKTKEELLRFRDLYQSSIIYSRNENIPFVTKIRERIKNSRLSKAEKDFILLGVGFDLISYEEE